MTELSRRAWLRLVGASGAAAAVWARFTREVRVEVRRGETLITHALPLAASGSGALDEYNVGIVDISADRMVVAGLGAGGRFYEETLTAEQLTARPI